MKTVCAINQCSSCKACINVCKHNAVNIVDDVRFCNAVIDSNKCINCGMCVKICPTNNPIAKHPPILWKQGWALDSDVRQQASSGGAASAIQHAFVENGGTVCSCCFDNGEYGFALASEPNDLRRFAGSKYVKSNPDKVYEKVNQLVKEKKKVLFVGLPCQCAAVKKITKDSDYLYTVDLICHGTPSPKLLSMFLEEKGYQSSCMEDLKFRKKMSFCLSDGDKSLEPKSVRDRYMIAFLKSLCYTENCYSCQYATLERVSDITLGDSWGSELDQDEQRKGVSLILCQTEKGRELLRCAKMDLRDVDLNVAIRNNRQLMFPSQKPDQYEVFFRKLNQCNNFNRAVKKSYPQICIRQSIKAFCVKHGIIERD